MRRDGRANKPINQVFYSNTPLLHMNPGMIFKNSSKKRNKLINHQQSVCDAIKDQILNGQKLQIPASIASNSIQLNNPNKYDPSFVSNLQMVTSIINEDQQINSITQKSGPQKHGYISKRKVTSTLFSYIHINYRWAKPHFDASYACVTRERQE